MFEFEGSTKWRSIGTFWHTGTPGHGFEKTQTSSPWPIHRGIENIWKSKMRQFTRGGLEVIPYPCIHPGKHTTSFRRCKNVVDVQTTSCAYWETSLHVYWKKELYILGYNFQLKRVYNGVRDLYSEILLLASCWHCEKTNGFIGWSFPVQTQRCFNVYATSITLGQRRINIKLTLCDYWVWQSYIFLESLHRYKWHLERFSHSINFIFRIFFQVYKGTAQDFLKIAKGDVTYYPICFFIRLITSTINICALSLSSIF